VRKELTKTNERAIILHIRLNDWMVIFMPNVNVLHKLEILGEAAKFDVSCSSSGVQRSGSGNSRMIGSSSSCRICHSFTEDGRCISLLKVLMSNDCVCDCKYCINRKNAERERATFTPYEIANLTIEFYKRNYIEGLFLSSAVVNNADYTMEQMCEAVRMLREDFGFFGYIHMKAIPGASPELVEYGGNLVDRMSVNIELPTEQSLVKLAPQKSKKNIFGAMKYIGGRIEEDKRSFNKSSRYIGGASMPKCTAMIENQQKNYSMVSEKDAGCVITPAVGSATKNVITPNKRRFMPASYGAGAQKMSMVERSFVPGGQSTQMIIGATDDSDNTIIKLSEALYNQMKLKRVYYSAYIPVNKDSSLPNFETPVPLLREHRLYQADWLLRFYGYKANELLDDKSPNLDLEYDPKCDWALRHLDLFPIDVNKADYYTLLRVPGMGVKSAQRIIAARKLGNLSFDNLKKIGLVMKRARYFLTCNGKTFGPLDMDPVFIKANMSIDARSTSVVSKYVQTSIFDGEMGNVSFPVNGNQNKLLLTN